MANDFRIWEIDDSSKAASPLKSTDRMETEESLEEVLVQNPDVLMPHLTIVGRQTPTDSGALDLLGVDADGKLVVFELKRGTLTREAVAQIVDYCSYLESLSEADLASYIAGHSGTNDVDKIDDFEAWYSDRQGGKELSDLRPTRMVLVGLGVDTRATRMVKFLAERGVDISLYDVPRVSVRRQNASCQTGGREPPTLAAPVVEEGTPTWSFARRTPSGPGSSASKASGRRCSTRSAQGPVTKQERRGITFFLPKLTLPKNNKEQNFYGSHSLVIDESGELRVTFFPAAVHVCKKKFEEQRKTILFEFGTPPHAPTTGRIQVQWSCRLNAETWNKHKEILTTLARDVREEWEQERQRVT